MIDDIVKGKEEKKKVNVLRHTYCDSVSVRDLMRVQVTSEAWRLFHWRPHQVHQVAARSDGLDSSKVQQSSFFPSLAPGAPQRVCNANQYLCSSSAHQLIKEPTSPTSRHAQATGAMDFRASLNRSPSVLFQQQSTNDRLDEILEVGRATLSPPPSPQKVHDPTFSSVPKFI